MAQKVVLSGHTHVHKRLCTLEYTKDSKGCKIYSKLLWSTGYLKMYNVSFNSYFVNTFLCELLYCLCIAGYFRRKCACVCRRWGQGQKQEPMFDVLNTLGLTLWEGRSLAELELIDLARVDGQQAPAIHLSLPSQHWDKQTFMWVLKTWTLVLMHSTDWASSLVLSLGVLQDSLSTY